MQKTKIVILGLGGVGGFYGGKLAHQYSNSADVDIYFVSRGNHLEAIRNNGLRVITDAGEFIAHPALATDNAAEIGTADYVILATKSYDLERSVEQLRPCIGSHTVILPLLNGGDITERIREILPHNVVWSGCSYIVSRRTEAGVIRSTGEYARLVFGYDREATNKALRTMETWLRDAGIDAVLSPTIHESIWQKFYFISVTASLTSYLNVNFNQLVDTPERRAMTAAMANEFLKIAEAEQVSLGDNLVEYALNRAAGIPPGATTSMHSDFLAGNRTELESLTGSVVRLARKHRIEAPIYEKVYEALKNK